MYYHVTPYENITSILNDGLIPQLGERSIKLGEEAAIFLFKSEEDVSNALGSWLGDCFEDDIDLALLSVDIKNISIDNCAGYEVKCLETICPTKIKFLRME